VSRPPNRGHTPIQARKKNVCENDLLQEDTKLPKTLQNTQINKPLRKLTQITRT